MNHVLIVDDDTDSATTLRELVRADRFSVAVAHTLRDARRQIALQPPDLVLLDMLLPDGNGLDLFSDRQLVSDSEIVLVTGHASLDSSIEAMRLGAADYLVKPIAMKQLQRVLSRCDSRPDAAGGKTVPAAAPRDPDAESGRFGLLWGRSAAMRRVYEQIHRVAPTSVTVLITGESGSGKELVAQTVHAFSRRQAGPFLAVNCGAISPHLMESEIFGHEKGSFTGADRQHLGFFERASGGTLFLDEITEMPLDLQVKLLRVLETGRFMRVGSTQSIQTDVRIIAATNRQPLEAVAQGKLREDLLYRLNVFPIELPSLRERLDDVPLLAQHFLEDISRREGIARHLDDAALRQLAAHPWPGNVRELRNAIHRAYVMADGEAIDARWLPGGAGRPVPVAALPAPRAAARSEPSPAGGGPAITLPVGVSMAQAERLLIQATLDQCQQQKERTAAVLGISLKTLYNRLKEYAGDSPSRQ
ncbi:MAG: response regulator [Hydrogenophaga sp.]|uniref:sigma-54-dependent transcriptional regulator n=1 Tax=Hydrogenophaga sp. TaxID=1904254 RepID=UPI0016B3E0C8|nr:sigma-54 dependent transcriptional regulator [Hydrogenophaga sp.]NIM41129.1 response regulator [Hydrogenophaga sp.]NIN26445.1 response regulator [Hydrogenophaga sp.]NIN31320.1 response regulator [Hydrogenophaga sp.]NIN55375.1 response regulator [Hydrogenophaga sp.]NIO51710.1 response regulator [Hydrogenophaga sp.]